MSDDHAWHTKPTAMPTAYFDDPAFVANALRRMVAACESLHPEGKSFYTDGERKVMTAAANHLDTFVKQSAH